jgi:hypothetical protein
VDVLQLDVSGRPQAWITTREAAVIYACDGVAWTLGDPCQVLRGGWQRHSGRQSRIEVHSIVAVRGAVPSRAWRHAVEDLTREHIQPTSRGGQDTWMNCITACRPCNGRKGNRMPEEARMSLLYLPYVPSLHEDMILRGRRILADQMEFLLASVPRSSRLHG